MESDQAQKYQDGSSLPKYEAELYLPYESLFNDTVEISDDV